MPIRRSPDSARHPRPQAGRDRPESVVATNRSGWTRSIGIAGRDRPVRAAKRYIIAIADDNRAPLDGFCTKLIAAAFPCDVMRNTFGDQ